MSAVKIAPEVLSILERSTVRRRSLTLPEQLSRADYVAVNKVLTMLGAKWDRASKSHLFATENEASEIATVLDTGQAVDLKKRNQFFETPLNVGKIVCGKAELDPRRRYHVLEPSCGTGALIEAILIAAPEAFVTGVEAWGGYVEDAERRYYPFTWRKPVIFHEDFMALGDKYEKACFDRVIMNPPFRNQQDVDHVLRAYEYVAPGGILVSVMSPSWEWRDNAKSREFRDFVKAHGGTVDALPEGAFAESGTNIRTVILKLRKPIEGEQQ